MANLPASGVLVADGIHARSQGVKGVFVVEREFDLSDLLDAVLANADVVNLFTLPENHIVIGAALEIITAGTDDATTFTLQLRNSTTALCAALSAVATGIAIGGDATYAMPLVCTTAAAINLVVVCSGGNAVVTLNPKVRVKLILCQMDKA